MSSRPSIGKRASPWVSRARRAVASYHPRRDHFWLTRHYVALSTLVTFAIAATTPASINAHAINAAGPLGWWAVAGLAAISFVALAESFISAFVPSWSCRFLRNRRHTLFMGMALGQLCLGYAVIVYSPSSTGLMLRLTLDATMATAVAYLDLFARHKAASVYT